MFQQKNPFIQPKLNVGKAGDKFEVEADSMAKKVVSNPGKNAGGLIQKAGLPEEEKVQKNSLPESTAKIQKQEIKEEEPVQKQNTEEKEIQTKTGEEEEQVQKAEITEEEPVQKQSEEEKGEEPIQMAMMEEQPEEVQSKTEEDEPLQAKNSPGISSRSSVVANIETPLSQSKGSGKAMDKKIKHEMESGFGADFSKVRIHTDDRAKQMSKKIGAQAFTSGNDIYFNRGKYNPKSLGGKLLLAHELTHTIQQKGMVQKKAQVAPGQIKTSTDNNL